jgi:solute carrier family 35 protein F1/2
MVAVQELTKASTPRHGGPSNNMVKTNINGYKDVEMNLVSTPKTESSGNSSSSESSGSDDSNNSLGSKEDDEEEGGNPNKNNSNNNDNQRGRDPSSLQEAESPVEQPDTSWIHHLQSNCKVLLLGQCLSLLLASAGATQATLHLSCGLSAPTFTMTTIYFGLAVIHIRILYWRHHHHHHHQDRVTSAANDDDDDDFDDVNVVLSPSSKNGIDSLQHRALSPKSNGGMHQSSLTPKENGDNNSSGASQSSRQYPTDGIQQPPTSQYSFFGLFPLHRSLWWYLMVAMIDVEANAITMLAYRYTTLTSVTVFDALAIPSAMTISRFWLGRDYQWMHYGGLAVCMTGVVINVLQDYQADKEDNANSDTEPLYPHKVRGDLCAIAGGLLYGLTNVLTEVTVQDTGDAVEYLGMMGTCAFFIALTQSLLFEWNAILEFFGEDGAYSSSCSLGQGWLLFFTFTCVTMMNYAGTSRFLMISEAAFFNLSLLTGDLWSVVFSIVAENIIPRPLFFLALVFVLSGVVLYEMAPSPSLPGEVKDYDGIHVTEEDDEDDDDHHIMMMDHRHQHHRTPIAIGKSSALFSGDDSDDDESDDGIELKESGIIS